MNGKSMTETCDPSVLREYAFAIADAEGVEHLPDGLVVERLAPRILASSVHLMPTLIDLKRSPALQLDTLFDLIQDTWERGEAPPVALFIKTNVSATEMARHWNAMQLAQPRLGRKLWLRLHDPRVLHQMLRILKAKQRQKLFGLSLAFTYWVGREWVTEERDSDIPADYHIDANGVQPYAGPLRWDWPRIERIGLVNRALHGAGIRHAAVLSSSGALAEQLMDRAAERHALVAHADLVEFAMRGLMIHTTFDEHPAVARVIRPDATSAEQSSLSDRLALIDEDVWYELRQPEKQS
jgi:hypothetical protein